MTSSMALQLRPKCRPISTPTSILHFFFSSSSTPDPNGGANFNDSNTTTTTTPQEPPSPKPSISSYFSDVKSSLKQQLPQRPTSQSPRNSSAPPRAERSPPEIASLQEIRKNLSEFRRRVAPPSSTETISFQELYKRNVMAKPDGSPAESAAPPAWGSGAGRGGVGDGVKFSLHAIRHSLNQFKPSTTNVDRKAGDPLSLSTFKDNLKLQHADSNMSSRIGGGSGQLPAIFDKEIRAKMEGGDSLVPAGLKTEFVKMYSHEELGKKLQMLRPEKKAEGGENWFSLTELNERLAKLREIEEKETESNKMGVSFRDLRDSLAKMKMSEDVKTKRSTIQRLDILNSLARTENFMLSPPKEQLVEKYFHPDNMSSAEKLKIELHKVRDEFKMSESDCGSARVQVAQLTTKIKHLSTALHKKDKHSRKGLQDMVQKRKKLLKYLRRTDWDSYCFVLSRLGLRDNPGYKTNT